MVLLEDIQERLGVPEEEVDADSRKSVHESAHELKGASRL